MKVKKSVFLVVLFWCIVCYAPTGVFAADVIKPPTEVETDHDLTLLGRPGGLPWSIMVRWKESETAGVSGYSIYEVFTGQNGQKEYVKVGNTEAGDTAYMIEMDIDQIMGCHSFVVTAVMPDGTESEFSETAFSRIYFHQRIRSMDVNTSSVSIEWDAPEFGEADAYEIWYCIDEYSYWKYYDDYDNIAGRWDIVYQKICGLPGSTKRYVVNGLKADTPYVFMVRSYQNGEVLDQSDFLQVKTAVPEWTQAAVLYKDANTGETVKTETIRDLKPGLPYTYQPQNSFETNNRIYTLDSTNAGQVLHIDTLSAEPEKNVITVYYTVKEKEHPVTREIERVFMFKPIRLSGQKIKLKWKKVEGASGYQVRYATNKKLRKPKTKTTDRQTLTLKKLKKGKTYYVKVRAYRLDSAGNRVYGAYSKVKKVKVKK